MKKEKSLLYNFEIRHGARLNKNKNKKGGHGLAMGEVNPICAEQIILV